MSLLSFLLVLNRSVTIGTETQLLSSTGVTLFASADYAEFFAQVRAEDPHREGWRHPEDDQQSVVP